MSAEGIYRKIISFGYLDTFNMGKAVKKIDVPDIDMEQPASSSKNKRKTPCQSKSKGSKKVRLL